MKPTIDVHLPTRDLLIQCITDEVDLAVAKHGNDQWSRHEFYAILKEEVDEAWDEIKRNGEDWKLKAEIVQIAAVCLRYLETQ